MARRNKRTRGNAKRTSIAVAWGKSQEFAVPIPQNEPERLEHLRSLKILDTPPEEDFDRITLLDLFDGLSVTGRHLFKKKVTIEYPEQKKLPSDRFRGMFRLDEERCIKCTLCAIECPINIIYIDWYNEKDEQNKPKRPAKTRLPLHVRERRRSPSI